MKSISNHIVLTNLAVVLLILLDLGFFGRPWHSAGHCFVSLVFHIGEPEPVGWGRALRRLQEFQGRAGWRGGRSDSPQIQGDHRATRLSWGGMWKMKMNKTMKLLFNLKSETLNLSDVEMLHVYGRLDPIVPCPRIEDMCMFWWYLLYRLLYVFGIWVLNSGLHFDGECHMYM